MTAKSLILIVPALIRVAFITLAERKVLRLRGFRQGPNKVSIQGILQPMADALKLANKSANYLSNYTMRIYYLSVVIIIFCSLSIWSCVSFLRPVINWKFSVLILIIILGVASIKAIFAGWRTYGKYPLIGRMRTVSQMVSYEAVLYLCVLAVIWRLKNFKVRQISIQGINFLYLIIPMVVLFWAPSLLAELNRTPYDFSEGERELVRGFNTEFGSRSFTIIFLREYRNIIFFMIITSIIFVSRSRQVAILVSFIFLSFWIIWIRRTLPRIRFDKFIMLAWKFYIPLMTIVIIVLFLEL